MLSRTPEALDRLPVIFPAHHRQCHTVGILERHHATMDDFYLCPDCRSEHAEPREAVLGHIARCDSCVLLLDVLAEEQAFLAAA